MIVFELDNDINNLKSIEIPIFVPLKRVPLTPLPLHEVITLLEQLPTIDTNSEIAPYLEVRVLLDGPEPALRHKIETALIGKGVKLTKIDVKYPTSNQQETKFISPEKLNELQPIDVFNKVYKSRYNGDTPATILQLFQQVAQEVNQTGE
ncbi:exonuclease subunit SbcD [compost metagenome]